MILFFKVFRFFFFKNKNKSLKFICVLLGKDDINGISMRKKNYN